MRETKLERRCRGGFSGLGAAAYPATATRSFFSDTLFTICPWWDGPTVRGTIETLLAADAKKRPRRWIWVHHAPPASSPTSWDGARYHGGADLERWILEYRPDFVLCGHVHQSPFRQGGSWADCVGPRDHTSQRMNAEAQRLSNLPRKEARMRMEAGISSLLSAEPLMRELPPWSALHICACGQNDTFAWPEPNLIAGWRTI